MAGADFAQVVILWHSGADMRSVSFRARFLTFGVLWLAAGLRWWMPGLIEFKYDEAHITGIALAIARGVTFPILSGGTTLGLQRSAFDAYVMAVFMRLLGGRPEIAVWGVASLGVVAAALTYTLGRRVAGPRVGLLAGVYMAANPWLVHYDRKLWAHIQVLLSVILLMLVWEILIHRRRLQARLPLDFWFPVLAALQLLSHVLALVQGLSWLGALLLAPRRWRWRALVAGGFVATLLLLPYGWALAQRWFAGGAALPGGFPAAATAAPPRLQSLFELLGGKGIAALAGLPSTAIPWWRWGEVLAWVVLGLILVGLGRVLGRAYTPNSRGSTGNLGARLLLVWFLGPLILLSLTPGQIFPQYWTVLIPLPAILFGLGADDALSFLSRIAVPRAMLGLTAGLILAIVIVWAGGYVAMLSEVQAGGGAAAFGIPLVRWQEAIDASEHWAATLGVDQVRVAVRGIDPAQDGDAAAVATLIGNPPFARFVAPASPGEDPAAALLLADGQPSLYLWAIDAPDTEARLSALGKQVWAGALARGMPARLYQLPPIQAVDLPIRLLDPPVQFDVGVDLIGYALPASANATQPIDMTLVWRMVAPTTDVQQRDFTAFNHIIDVATGERVAQADGMAMLSRDWWPGDVLIQPYRLTLAPGRYVWRTGLYSRADGGRSQVLTGGDSIDLGPFEVR